MIEELLAKQYIRKRLQAESDMIDILDVRVKEAIVKILAVLKKYNIKPKDIHHIPNNTARKEIDDIIKWLIDTLFDDVQTIAIEADTSQKDYITAFITMPIAGLTVYSRIEAWAKSIYEWFASLYAHGLKATPNVLPHKTGSVYGMGRLLRHTIARAWMEAKKQKAMDNDAVFFSTHRGSSYPCAVCDDEQAKGLQPISQFSLPLHNNCCCYATFYNKDKQPINI